MFLFFFISFLIKITYSAIQINSQCSRRVTVISYIFLSYKKNFMMNNIVKERQQLVKSQLQKNYTSLVIQLQIKNQSANSLLFYISPSPPTSYIYIYLFIMLNKLFFYIKNERRRRSSSKETLFITHIILDIIKIIIKSLLFVAFTTHYA